MAPQFFFGGTEAYFIIYWIHVSVLFLPSLIHCCSMFHFSFLTGTVTPECKAAQILSRLFWFSACCFLIVVMLQVPCLWWCSHPRKTGPFPFVKVTFLTGLMMTYPFLSLGRCASWILLLYSDQRALWQSAPPASVQNAVLLWQRPVLVCRCSRRSWNVPHQIHRYEPTCILKSVVEHWVRQWFSFISNVFIKELQRMLEAGGHLGVSFSPTLLLKAEPPMAGCSGPPGG